ncbi:transcriptional regulator domain-containing protein [Paraburkholderia caribensis]|uniref:transcriptional regulator domain-containing protein n=1 Tax=Paraburkholderia caribensis TaxID=75105 RepID=UPI000B25C11E|nr:DUF2285 domain-containing protein [Paraburkholderia caribensis]
MNPKTQPEELKNPLPDGSDINAYVDWEAWDYRRLGWEYLRRNEEFRAGCSEAQKLQGDERVSKEQQIAEKFMLRDFRDCDATITVDDAIAFLAQRTFEPKAKHIKLRDYEVAIAFDLRFSLYAKDAIEIQLENAKRTLQKRSEQLKRRTGIEEKPSSVTTKRESHIDQLRILDLRRSGRTWKEVAAIMQPKSNKNSASDFIEVARKKHAAGLRLIDFGYVRLFASSASRKSLPRRSRKD